MLTLEQTNEVPKVVLYGDSVGCTYKMKFRVNSYTSLLARRLSKPVALDYISGANSTLVLNCLTTDERRIQHLTDAEIVVLSVGGNNVLVTFLMAFVRALDLGPLGAKTMKEIAQKFRSDKLAGPKALKELLGKKTKEDAMAGVETFRKEFPAILLKMKEINPDAIIIVHNVYNPFNTLKNKLQRIVGRPMGKFLDMLNEIIAENQAELGFLLVDIESAFKNYKGKDELTHIKTKDMHLTDFGHLTIYRLLYDALVKAYPQYECEESPDVIKTLKNMTKEEKKVQKEKDALDKALTEGGDTNFAVQPDDFSNGELKKYNDWFTGEAAGMKFYPLKKVELAVENTDAAKALEINESVFFKIEDGSVAVYNQGGIKLGLVANEPVDSLSPTIAFTVKNNFPNTVKVFTNGEKMELIYAIYPTREYYAESVKKDQKQEEESK